MMDSVSPLTYSELLEPENRQVCIQELKDSPVMVRPARAGVGPSSAVLIPVCRLPNGQVGLLYTKRNPFLRVHPRQVCFPGGRCDPGETVEETALREAHEELGLPPDRVDVWTAMKPVADRQGVSSIYPVVGEVKGAFSVDQLTLNRDEVESVFVSTLADLNDPKVKGYTQFRPFQSEKTNNNRSSPKQAVNGYSLPVFRTQPYPVWGLTAIITFQFLSVFLRRSSSGYRHPLHFRSPMKT